MKASIAGEMGAIGPGPADDLGMSVEQERDVAALHLGATALARLIRRPLVGVGEPQAARRDVGGVAELRRGWRKRRHALAGVIR